MNAKFQIAVLMGGPSEEREVSLRSGKAVMAALQRQGHAVHAVDPCEGTLSLPTQVDPHLLSFAYLSPSHYYSCSTHPTTTTLFVPPFTSH